MSPPMTPAPIDVHVLELAPALPASALSRSCSRNTRIRLRAVSLWNSAAIECASAVIGRLAARAVARPQVDDGVGGRVVLAPGVRGDLPQQRRAQQRAHSRPAQSRSRQRRAMRRRGGAG